MSFVLRGSHEHQALLWQPAARVSREKRSKYFLNLDCVGNDSKIKLLSPPHAVKTILDLKSIFV